jgi:hypothetical protein
LIRDIELEHQSLALGRQRFHLLGLRAVTTVRKPRASVWVASSRPKPVEQPVINQTGFPILADVLLFVVIIAF